MENKEVIRRVTALPVVVKRRLLSKLQIKLTLCKNVMSESQSFETAVCGLLMMHLIFNLGLFVTHTCECLWSCFTAFLSVCAV